MESAAAAAGGREQVTAPEVFRPKKLVVQAAAAHGGITQPVSRPMGGVRTLVNGHSDPRDPQRDRVTAQSAPVDCDAPTSTAHPDPFPPSKHDTEFLRGVVESEDNVYVPEDAARVYLPKEPALSQWSNTEPMAGRSWPLSAAESSQFELFFPR